MQYIIAAFLLGVAAGVAGLALFRVGRSIGPELGSELPMGSYTPQPIPEHHKWVTQPPYAHPPAVLTPTLAAKAASVGEAFDGKSLEQGDLS